MSNYPTISGPTPWSETDQEVTDYVKCHVTEDLYREDEMTLDINTGRFFHKSLVSQYVELCRIEFGWNEEEMQGALNEFNQ